MLHPFRFGSGAFPRTRTELIALARKVEELGYATILVADEIRTVGSHKDCAW